MEEENNQQIQKESNYNLQDYLSLGYVFLLILGVLNQTIYYGFLGINYIEYSSVLDVLLSPIAVITSDRIIFITFLVLIPLMIGYFRLMHFFYKKLARKEKYQSGKNKEKMDKILSSFEKKYSVIPFILFVIISMFIGLGVGSGIKIKKRINSFDYNYNNQLTFEDGETKKIKMLGKNSLYVFYVTKDTKEVSVSPIEGNIKTIQNLKEE